MNYNFITNYRSLLAKETNRQEAYEAAREAGRELGAALINAGCSQTEHFPILRDPSTLDQLASVVNYVEEWIQSGRGRTPFHCLDDSEQVAIHSAVEKFYRNYAIYKELDSD